MGPPLGRQGQSVNDEERPSTDDSPDFDSTDSPSRPATRRRRYEERVYRRNVSTVDEVMGEATGYVSAFFADRMDRDGYRVPEEMWEASRNANSENGRLLRQIGDDLDSNQELNNMISSIKVTADNVMEIFGSLITETFRDGTINWGRIVTLMFVGYKLAVKVLFEGDVLKMIIKGVVEYIGKKLVHWIVNCGGWDACRSYFGSTSAQLMGVFLAGCAVTALVFWLKGK